MTKLKVKTASTQAGKAVAVPLGTECRRALVKNFSTGDIWVGVTPHSFWFRSAQGNTAI